MITIPAMNTKRSIWFHIVDITLNIVIIVAIVGIIRTFLISPFQVDGRSMVPTLEDGQYIIINKLVYFLQSPVRGESVVFRPPNDRSKYYVKRIIGQPGDTVIIKEGFVYIQTPNNTEPVQLEETYLNVDNYGNTFPHPPNIEYTEYNKEIHFTVPEGYYFVMGDNRKGSSDSRSFKDANNEPIPFVPQADIKGRVWFIALPIKSMHALTHAVYDLSAE